MSEIDKARDELAAMAVPVPRMPEPKEPEPIDLAALSEMEPEPVSFHIACLLPKGAPALLAGHGGSGKSHIAVNAAVSLAAGVNFLGFETDACKVVYLSFEDRESTLQHRLKAITSHLGLDPASITHSLHVYPMSGFDSVLWRSDAGKTGLWHWVKTEVQLKQAGVLIIDGVSDVFSGNENDRCQVKQFMNATMQLVEDDGSVLLLHHTSKVSAATGSKVEAYSGSTGWHNGVRARWAMLPQEDGSTLLELQKSNLGRSGESVTLRWDDTANTFIGERNFPPSEFEKRETEKAECEQVLAAIQAISDRGDYVPAATTGNKTCYHILSVCPEFPPRLKDNSRSSKRRFLEILEELRRMRAIKAGSIRRKDRKTTETIEPNAFNGVGCANAANVSKPVHDAYDAPPSAAHAANAHRGYKGDIYAAPCPRCNGNGCRWCRQ